MTVTGTSPNPKGLRLFGWWLAGLAGLTGLGVGLLRLTGVNPDNGFSPAILLIGYASSLSAVVAVGVVSGKQELWTLLKRMTRWRVHGAWYLVALVGPSVLILLANVLYQLFGGHPAWFGFFDLAALGAGLGAMFAGFLGEELGWRGLAQPVLQRRYSALLAAIAVGASWATWHLWPLLAPGGSVHLVASDIVQTYVRLISTAVIYAWIYNSTRGSLLLVMLAHTGHNLAINLMPAPTNAAALSIAALYLAAACVVVAMAGSRSLTTTFASQMRQTTAGPQGP